MGVPLIIILFILRFSLLNNPFWGVAIYGNFHMEKQTHVSPIFGTHNQDESGPDRSTDKLLPPLACELLWTWATALTDDDENRLVLIV